MSFEERHLQVIHAITFENLVEEFWSKVTQRHPQTKVRKWHTLGTSVQQKQSSIVYLLNNGISWLWILVVSQSTTVCDFTPSVGFVLRRHMYF